MSDNQTVSSGSSRLVGYRPEVRTSYHTPTTVLGQIVDGQWREIKFHTRNDLSGIPTGYFDKELGLHGLLGRAQAEAIRWWFLAQAEAESVTGALCLETRLKSYELVLTHKVIEKEALPATDFRGKVIEEPK